jgi:hypothetical protein
MEMYWERRGSYSFIRKLYLCFSLEKYSLRYFSSVFNPGTPGCTRYNSRVSLFGLNSTCIIFLAG